MAARKAKKTAIISAGVISLIAIIGGVMYFLTGGSGETIAAGDYRTLAIKDNAQRVSVSGKVEAEKSMTLSTRLTVPVATLNAKVGDRVQADQLLATLDVSQLELDLMAQQAQNAATDANSVTQIETAERQAAQYQEMLDSGHNQEINTAEAALREAEASYEQANRDFELERSLHEQGRTPEITQQETALNNARHNAVTAAINVVRAGVGLAAGGEGTQPIEGGLNAADAVNQAVLADTNLKDAQRDYETVLAQVDNKLVTSQQGVANAFEAKKEASVNLETAWKNAENQLANNQAAVDDAVRQARAQRAAAGAQDEKLLKDIASSEVRSPFEGVITDVPAQQGLTTNGPILTVADDSRMIIHAEIKELDIAKVQPGQRVEFTTPGTGDKKYEGKVIFVSPTASSNTSAMPATEGAPAANANTAPTNEKVTFPIEIEVSGNKEGLRLGATAKTRIVTKEPTKQLSVPAAAIFKDGAQSKVLVVADDTIVERKIKPGETINGEVQITSGDIKKGETVLTDAEKYRELIGQKVRLEENPAAESTAATTTEKESS